VIVTYWGVRGSVPVPGPGTVRYGGNTSCVTVRRGDSLLVIDAGTGIVPLGDRMDPEIAEVLVLLSHRHMDHVQGLPFFAPLYESGPPVALLDLRVEGGWWNPLELFDGVAVPMRPERLGAAVRRVEGDPVEALRRRGWEVERLDLRHPGGSAGFLVREGGGAFAHLTDTDLGGASDDAEFFRSCVDFCRGVDVLSHDAQYRAAEMPSRRGRGHSSVERACDLAEAAGVGRLVLFHHDPGRDDAALDEIGRWAAGRLAGSGIECTVACEGLELEVGGRGDRVTG
jgi:phosphoribosyl 1,2-cyclic phosphodiesterase